MGRSIWLLWYFVALRYQFVCFTLIVAVDKDVVRFAGDVIVDHAAVWMTKPAHETMRPAPRQIAHYQSITRHLIIFKKKGSSWRG